MSITPNFRLLTHSSNPVNWVQVLSQPSLVQSGHTVPPPASLRPSAHTDLCKVWPADCGRTQRPPHPAGGRSRRARRGFTRLKGTHWVILAGCGPHWARPHRSGLNARPRFFTSPRPSPRHPAQQGHRAPRSFTLTRLCIWLRHSRCTRSDSSASSSNTSPSSPPPRTRGAAWTQDITGLPQGPGSSRKRPQPLPV